MCGIAGVFYYKESTQVVDRTKVQHMLDKIRHRGPDDSGIFVDGSTLL